MAAAGKIGYGSTLSLGGAAVGKIVDIKGPAIKAMAVKTSNNDSPAAWHEYIPGWTDPGEITFTAIAVTANRSAINALIATTAAFVLTFSDTHTWTGSCIVTGLDDDDPLEGAETISVTVQVTGKPVYA